MALDFFHQGGGRRERLEKVRFKKCLWCMPQYCKKKKKSVCVLICPLSSVQPQLLPAGECTGRWEGWLGTGGREVEDEGGLMSTLII
jgi:hypothetical protein